MHYIIGFIILIFIIMFVAALALWVLNFLLIAIKWIALVCVFIYLIYAFIKLVEGQKDKRIKDFIVYLSIALSSFLVFSLSDYFQPKLHNYLTSANKTEEVKKEKTTNAVAASKQKTEAFEKTEEEKQKEKEVAKAKAVEAKKKAEAEAKKKAEEQAKKKAEELAKKKAEEEAKKPISTDFSSFDNPYDNMTDLQKDEYWKKVKGKYVQWTGKVVEVTEDSVSVICESDTLLDDFGATIVKEQRDSLININVDDTITIYGQLSLKEGVIISWQLDNAQITN